MTKAISNSLWNFSLSHYGQPQVAAACLQLQDNYGVNINILLWSLWLESQGKWLSETRLAAALTAAAPWDVNYVQPLRQLRRRIKQEFAADLAQVARLRDQLKHAELLAEQQEQLSLEALSRDWPGGEKELPQGENLSLYLAYLGLAPEIVSRALGECGAYEL